MSADSCPVFLLFFPRFRCNAIGCMRAHRQHRHHVKRKEAKGQKFFSKSFGTLCQDDVTKFSVAPPKNLPTCFSNFLTVTPPGSSPASLSSSPLAIKRPFFAYQVRLRLVMASLNFSRKSFSCVERKRISNTSPSSLARLCAEEGKRFIDGPVVRSLTRWR